MNVAESLDWLQYASADEIDQALEAGEFDELLACRGLGRMTDEQAGLVARIEWHFPAVGLDQRVCRWNTLESGSVALLVDARVLFTIAGDDLVVTGELSSGLVGCVRHARDRSWRLGALAPDEDLLAASVSLN